MGARHAAKALVMAADAASSPDPAGNRTTNPSSAPAQPRSSEAPRSGTRIVEKAAQTTAQVRQTTAGVARGGKRFGEAVWGPFAKASGQLWLELTGVFFGLFVMTALMNVWKLRANLHDTGLNHTEHLHLEWSIVMATVFGYFCVSSFVRANRKGRSK